MIYIYENQPPASLDALTQRFQRLEARQSPDGSQQWLNWVLRQRSDGKLIGYVQATVQADGRALVAYERPQGRRLAAPAPPRGRRNTWGGPAFVSHELASRHWGQGLGSEAVQAMLDELAGGRPAQQVQPVPQVPQVRPVRQALAIFKRPNHRSLALLLRLGFTDAATDDPARGELEPDERLMARSLPA